MKIQRNVYKSPFNYEINVLSGEVFSDPTSGVFIVMDNKIRSPQSGGKTLKLQNVLDEKDVPKLYVCNEISGKHPKEAFEKSHICACCHICLQSIQNALH